MDQDDLMNRLAAATGESLFAGLLLPVLWQALIANGSITKEQSIETIDGLLLIIETKRQATLCDLGAIDHARSRLQALLERCSRM